MTSIETWSVKLANEVAPDEVALAPVWAAAFVQGGEARRELLAQARTGVGGFAVSDVSTLLPMVFGSLLIAEPAIRATIALLKVKEVGDLLSITKTALSLIELRQRAPRTLKAIRQREQEPLVPAGQDYVPLRRLVDTLGAALQSAGLDDDRRDLVTFRVVKVLLEDPDGALKFVESSASR